MDREPAAEIESLSQLRRLDGACLRFEQLWQQGQRPSIEQFLADAAPPERSALLVELLALEWVYRRQRGETFERGEYTSRLADWAGLVDDTWGRWMEMTHEADSPSTVGPANTMHQPAGSSAVAPLDGYQELHELGRGGMGVVYRAYDPGLARFVAVKMIHTGAAHGERLERFRLEARAMARLKHPHVVQVHGLVEKPGQPPVLVMEYVEGGSLEANLRRQTLAPPEAARLVAILARAVQAAHAAGVVHRDLKPANVLMAPPVPGNSGNVAGGFPKVTDFGLAQLAGGLSMTMTGQVVGTPAYMAPEQADGRTRDVGQPADVWALGVILYRCLAGELPFAGDTVLETLEKVRSRPPAPLRRLAPGVPEALEALCLRCLDKLPANRPSAEELASQLERWQAEQGAEGPRWWHATAKPRTSPEAGHGDDTEALPPPAPRRRRRVIAACAVLAVLAAGVGAWAWAGRLFAPVTSAPSDDKQGTTPIVKKEEKKDEPKREDKTQPAVRVARLGIDVWAVTGRGTEYRGEIARGIKGAKFGDGVSLEVELTAPGHAYLLAFNTDGKEQLLWPPGGDGRPDERVAPPRVAAFQYPGRKGPNGEPVLFFLDDEERGGWQAFAVVTSRQPLPPFGRWKAQRGAVSWVKGKPGVNVWHADDRGLRLWAPGKQERGTEGVVAGAPPLLPLVRALRAGPGVEAAEAWAFAVRPKGE